MKNFAVYNASAGSGKTFTLVKEYLKIALGSENDGQYKNILAVTFTNKAAAEMKERVISALQALSGKTKLEGTPKHLQQSLLLSKEEGGLGISSETLQNRSEKVLKSILHNYSNFSIGTIDKFTHKVIRTFAHDLHLPLNFDIELNENEVLDKSIDMLIAQIGANEKVTKLLIEYAEKKADDEQSWHIEKDLKDFSKNLLKEDGEKYLQTLKNLTVDDFENIKKDITKEVKQFEEKVKSLSEKVLQELQNKGIEEGSFSRSFYPAYWKKVQNFTDFSPTATMLKIINGEQNWYAQKVDTHQKNLIDDHEQDLIAWFSELQDFLTENESNYRINLLLIKNLYNLAVLNEIEKLITEYKKENSVLSISDFNKRIAQIVASEPMPFIYERLGERYQHYLIDEFQDTSIVQWHNLIPLVDNSLAGGNYSMIVGDAKQAIYRFRGGEVEQIIKLPNIYNHNNNQILLERQQAFIRNHSPEDLKANYRSKAEIVEFNNRFFNFISAHLSEDYKHIYENLAQEFNPENKGGGVAIDFIDTEDNDEFDELTYQKITAIIEETTNSNNQYKLEDIAILTRDNKNGSAIASELLGKGIPVVSSESLLLNSSKDVQFVLNVFHYLANPHEASYQLPILNYLINHQFQEDQLIDVYQAKNAETLNNYLVRKNISIDYQTIANYSLYELTEYIIKHFSLDGDVNIYLQFFLDKVQEYASRFDNSVINFLEWWKAKSDKFSVVIPEGIDAVKVMSIHKSKGLEFPVVIYPYATSESKNTEKFTWIQETDTEQLPVAIVPIIKELQQTKLADIYNTEENKSILDLINILYVAFTRPKDRLYILTKEYHQPKNESQSTKVYVNKLLQSYCEQCQQNKNKEGTYFFGSFLPNQNINTDEFVNSNEEFKEVVYNNWRDKIAVSLQAPENWEVENPETAAEHGKLMHHILAEIKTKEDVEQVLHRYFIDGTVNEEEAKTIQNEIDDLLKDPIIEPFFTEFEELNNERAILLPSGETYQPDRVVKKAGQTYILDYKTGQKEKHHEKQLLNYQSILLQMGYQNVSSYLLYLKDKELVAVN